MHYADTSALVKLVVREPETEALLAWLSDEGVSLATSDVARTELLRAVRRVVPQALSSARNVLSRIMMIAVDSTLLDEAARLDPIELRSLDAIHLASALRLGDELESFVAYDDRLASAARELGLTVVAPASLP